MSSTLSDYAQRSLSMNVWAQKEMSLEYRLYDVILDVMLLLVQVVFNGCFPFFVSFSLCG